jgi:hypothetical protein
MCVCVRARAFVHFNILLQDILQVKSFYGNECGHAVGFTCPLYVFNLRVNTAVSAIL